MAVNSKHDEKPLVRLINLAVSKAHVLIALLVLVGYGGFLALPLFERPVKFGEKALMVGGAHALFRSSGTLEQGIKLAADVHAAQHSSSTSSVVAVLLSRMQAMGLEVYTSHAGSVSGSSPNSTVSCTNIHAIQRSATGDGKEALVLVTPVALTRGHDEAWGSRGDAPAAGAPLLLAAAAALLAHLQLAGWLAKDMIWLVPDARCGSLHSTRRWTQMYQGAQEHAGVRGFGRAGVMQQAVVIMADRVDISSLEVLVEGDQGQLPKLDMYNLLYANSWALHGVHALARDLHARPWRALGEALGIKLQPGPVSEYAAKLAALTHFVARQASGLPTGPHTAFKDFMVDAATARLGGKGPDGALAQPVPVPPIDLTPGGSPLVLHPHLPGRATQLAEYLEVIFRSLNNLDERFNHAYFLYLLTSPQHFVTVEVYIVPLVALIAVLILKAAAIRQQMVLALEQCVHEHVARSECEKDAAAQPAASSATDAGCRSHAGLSKDPGTQAPHNTTTMQACRDEATRAMASVWGRSLADAAAVVVGAVSTVWAVRSTVCTDPSVGHSSHMLNQLTTLEMTAAASCLAFGGWAVATAVMPVQKEPRPDPSSDAWQAGITSLATKVLRPAAMRVALLSLTGMQLTAMASLNWALAYAVAALLAPVVCAAPCLGGTAGRWPGRVSTLVPVAAVAAMLCGELWSSGRLGYTVQGLAVMDATRALVCGAGSWMSYAVIAASLLPCCLIEMGTSAGIGM